MFNKRYYLVLITLVLSFIFTTVSANAQTSSFVYQGKLQDGGTPANGTYQFQFKLYDVESGGSQIGLTLSDVAATVTNGIFSVQLNFGSGAFNSQNFRYLEIGVRLNGSGQAYTTLTPRQQITSTPYAIRALSAQYADTAETANDSANLGGIPASQYVVTTDSRMSDERNPLPGSANYIQNASSQQSNSNFNISGEGKAFKVTGVFLNATSEFQQGGARVMQFNAQKSGYVGLFAGMNATGADNMFVGYEAGKATTTGSFNSFFGSQTGKSNNTGFNNSFFGAYAGTTNTTGNNNSFFGINAGLSNNGGSSNSFFGSGSGFQNFSGTDNSFFGASSGLVNTTGSNNSFFGRSAGESVSFAANNSFFGAYAGENTTTGGNSYFGADAGQKNTVGASNTFIGYAAGMENTGGSSNTFIGALSGPTVGTNGNNNITIGYNTKINGNISNAIVIGSNIQVSSSNTVRIGNSGDTVQLGNINASSLSSSGNLNVSGSGSFSTVNAGTVNAGSADFDEVTINGSFQIGSVHATSNGLFDGTLKADSISTKTLWNGGSANLCYVQSGGYLNIAHCSSSRRYKENIQNYAGGLNLLKQLRPVTFSWKSNGQKDVGFVAEEINEVEPLLNNYNEKGEVEGVKYAQVTTVLVNAVKEQQTQIEKLEEQIKLQKEQIELLKALVCSQNPDAAVCNGKTTTPEM